MAPRRPPPSRPFDEPKRKRKVMTVKEKVILLDMVQAGHSYASVARHYGINESTVRYIKKEEVNIRKAASLSFFKDTKQVVTTRNKQIVKMENELSEWISDCLENEISLSTNMIRAKAKALYDSLVSEEELNEDNYGNEPQPSTSASSDPTTQEKLGFVASKGWFDRFKRRFSIGNISLYKEASSADKAAALHYVKEEFPEIIDEGGCLPGQVFNMDETGLIWKRNPSQASYKDKLKTPGIKAHKDSVTIFMCGNDVNPPTDKEPVEMTKSASEEKQVADDRVGNEAGERGFSSENLQELCNLAQSLQQKAQKIDDNKARALEFSKRIDGVMALYKDIVDQKKKQSQLPITMFLVPQKRFAKAPPSASKPPTTTTPSLSKTDHANSAPLAPDKEVSPEGQ